MQVQETFANNVRELRVRAGLSQEMLAEKSGMHRTYIGSIEQMRANITLKNVECIAEALGVDPAVLFIDGLSSREDVVSDYAIAVDAMIEDAPKLEIGSFALCNWENDGSVRFAPVGVYSEDLTLRVLCILVEEGYANSLEDLTEAYESVAAPVLDFVRSFKNRELDKKQHDFIEARGLGPNDFGQLIG